jgi:transcriptional regulator with XRE-family HTH domain
MSEPVSRLSPASGDRSAVRQMLARIREQRLARNWTQTEMAHRCGLSRASYQNLEGGFGNITLANLVRVLGILGLASRLADLVPPVEDPRTLESAYQAPRQRAHHAASRK